MKYAPANAEGLKPWVVAFSSWGHKAEHLVYAETRRSAEYQMKGRQLHVSAVGRRATPEDMERLS